MKILILGATGSSGQRLVSQGLAAGHQVTVLVRNEAKFRALLGEPVPSNLTVHTGDAMDSAALLAAMAGQQAVINAAGTTAQPETFVPLVSGVIAAAQDALGPGGRFWLFGGAAALDVPGTSLMGVDLPGIPKIYEAHRANLARVRATSLDWSMLCPGPLIPAQDGQPQDGLRVSAEVWPVPRPTYTHFLPRAALSLAMKQKMPQMVITYEDAARVILDNLVPDGPFSRKRVGVALPPGLSGQKDFATGGGSLSRS